MNFRRRVVSKVLIPKYHRQMLKRIGHPHWFWYRIDNWAWGERYKFINGVVAYLFDGEIVTLRRSANIIWRKEDVNG
jgi:hypothetical protein